MIALLNLSVLGFSFVVFHDKAKRTQQENLLTRCTLIFITGLFTKAERKRQIERLCLFLRDE